MTSQTIYARRRRWELSLNADGPNAGKAFTVDDDEQILRDDLFVREIAYMLGRPVTEVARRRRWLKADVQYRNGQYSAHHPGRRRASGITEGAADWCQCGHQRWQHKYARGQCRGEPGQNTCPCSEMRCAI